MYAINDDFTYCDTLADAVGAKYLIENPDRAFAGEIYHFSPTAAGCDMSESDRVGEFVQLLTAHELRLRAFVMSIVPNHSDAEDVLQEGKLLIWKHFDKFQSGTSFMSWAGRIVYTSAMQHYKRQRRDKTYFGEKFINAVAKAAVMDEVVSECGNRELHLGDCIAKLQPEHQDILRERYINNKSVDRMVVQFDRSPAGILNVLSRIRKFLNGCVTKKLQQEGLGA